MGLYGSGERIVLNTNFINRYDTADRTVTRAGKTKSKREEKEDALLCAATHTLSDGCRQNFIVHELLESPRNLNTKNMIKCEKKD